MSAPPVAPIIIGVSNVTSTSRDQVAPGDILVIRGQFLQNATSATLGGVALSIAHNTAAQILARVPSPAPSGTIKVTTKAGSGTSPKTFTGKPSGGSNSGGTPSPTPPPAPPRSPSQQGADAANAYNAAYSAATSAAEAAYQAAGGDAGGVAAHVAAQNAASAAAKQAAGAGQEATARRAANTAYNDFKTSQLGANNGPKPPGINDQGGSDGAQGAGAMSPGLSQLIATMNQWMQVLPQPLQTLARAATSIAQVALSMGSGIQGLGGGKGGALWSHFRNAMDVSAKDAFDAKNGGPSGGYGPHQVPPLPPRLQGIAEWAGRGIGQFAGKLGLVDAAGAVPPAMAGAIAAGVGTLLIASIGNVKSAFAAGQSASDNYTSGLRSGFGAIEAAARDVTGRFVSQLMKPFGASGGAIAGFSTSLLGGLGSTASNLAGMGADLRKTMSGLIAGAGTVGLGVGGALIGALAGGPVGLAIGAFIGTGIGLLITKIVGAFNDLIGKGFEVIGKVAGEVFRVGGEAVQAFVSVIQDCTQAAQEWAHTARSIGNRAGFSDSTAAGYTWALQGLGLSSGDVRGMFGSATDGQFNRALTGAAWGVRGMPISGDFDTYAYLGNIYEKAQSLKKSMGPLGAQFQQSFLNSTGNGAMLDAVNLSPTAFFERLNFARQFDPSGRGENVGRFEEGFGTLMSQWNTFTSWLKVSFGSELLPFLKEMFGGVVGWVKQNKSGILDAVKGAANWIYKEMPSLILGGLRVMVVGVANIAGVMGRIVGAIGSNLPTILKGVEGLINGFRNITAMGMGMAAVAANIATKGWIKGLVGAPDAYAKGQAGFLKNFPEFHMESVLPLSQQKILAGQMQNAGKWLKGVEGSIDGSKPNGSITDNWVPKLDKLLPQYDPAKRDLLTANSSRDVLEQIARNTAGVDRLGEEVGKAVGFQLTTLEYMTRRNMARDQYYGARRA